MAFLYSNKNRAKAIVLISLPALSIGVILVLYYPFHSNTALILSILGLSYLFIGSLLSADALGRWGSHGLWTYKYGSVLQGLGFVISLSGLMVGQPYFQLPNLEWSAEWVTAGANLALTIITLVGVGYAILQYQLNKRDKDERERPYVFVDLESVNQTGLFDLVIRNTGSSPAKNIRIEFTPDIKLHDYSEATINNMKIMQDMKFLAPGKTLQFFFGSVIGGKTIICQEFKLVVAYKNTKGKDFREEQTLDPRDYLELSHLSQKGLNDIGKSLESIAKSLTSGAKHQERSADILLAGITQRNSDLVTLKENELRAMLVNIVKYGHEYELVIGRSSEDTKAVIRALRDKLLTKQKPDIEDQTMIKRLSDLLIDRFMSGSTSFEDELKKLAGEIDVQA